MRITPFTFNALLARLLCGALALAPLAACSGGASTDGSSVGGARASGGADMSVGFGGANASGGASSRGTGGGRAVVGSGAGGAAGSSSAGACGVCSGNRPACDVEEGRRRLRQGLTRRLLGRKEKSSNSPAHRPMRGLQLFLRTQSAAEENMKLKQPLTVLLTVSITACAAEPGDAAGDAEALGRDESALCGKALSPSQEKTALKLIDDICGDTWCEGDNNFAFERLTCRTGAAGSPNGGTCTLKLQIIPRVDDPPSYSRACTTHGFYGFDSLVETAQSGYQSLDWDFYLALTDCISELESALPH